MSFTMKSLSRGLALGVTLAMVACSAEEPSASDSLDVTGDGQSLSTAYNVSDFNNFWRLEGHINYFEGQATLVLQNATQPNKPLIKQTVHEADGSTSGTFSADVRLGDITDDDETIPAVGDCIAVKTDGGPRGLSEAEIRNKREFGAFVYVSDPLSGAPKRPAWGLGQDGRGEIYKTVAECLDDQDRGWAKANPNDKLQFAINPSGLGRGLVLKGEISQWELAASFALVNVSDVREPLILEKGFASSGTFQESITVPESVRSGDCIAIKNTTGGRGFSDEETRAKEEFGAFLFIERQDLKVFPTTAACLKDAAATQP